MKIFNIFVASAISMQLCCGCVNLEPPEEAGDIENSGGILSEKELIEGARRNLTSQVKRFAEAPDQLKWAEAPDQLKWIETPDNKPFFEQQSGRKRSFSVMLSFHITGASHSAVKKVSNIAEKFSGYVAQSDMSSATIKIPVKNADVFITQIEKIGEITHREFKCNDVTEEYSDLEIKCKNLLALRDRYTELLKKTSTVTDVLEIEKELGRVCTEYEQIKGKLNLLKNQVEMAEVFVTFASVSKPEIENKKHIPVAWIRSLGRSIYNQKNFDFNQQSAADEFPVKCVLPAGFVKVCSEKRKYMAINSDNCKLLIRNYDCIYGTTAEFYRKLILNHLKQTGFVDVVCKKVSCGINHGFSISARNGKYTYQTAVVFYKSGCIFKQDKVLSVELSGETADMKTVDIAEVLEKLTF